MQGSTVQLHQTTLRGPEFASSMMECEGPFTNVTKGNTVYLFFKCTCSYLDNFIGLTSQVELSVTSKQETFGSYMNGLWRFVQTRCNCFIASDSIFCLYVLANFFAV